MRYVQRERRRRDDVILLLLSMALHRGLARIGVCMVIRLMLKIETIISLCVQGKRIVSL